MTLIQITLEAARVNKKLTQTQAAEKLGVSVSTLQRWERGEGYPTYPQITKICEMYELSFDNIFFG